MRAPHELRSHVDGRADEVLRIDPITNGGITASLEAPRMADEAGLETRGRHTDELSAHLLRAPRGPIWLEKHAFVLDPCHHVQPRAVVDHEELSGRPREAPVPA